MSRLWSPEEDAIALRGQARGESVPLIASKLKRTPGGVRARLRLISDQPIGPARPDTSRMQALREENARRVRAAHAVALRGAAQWP